jgi:phosphoribosyl 1,2-cyclic phosphate phosphodiesterase
VPSTSIKITFLGTGTSMGVPVIGCGCAVCQSTDIKDKRLRTSMLIEYAGAKVVIDSGPDFREQMLRHNVDRLDGLVFTHEHKDHTAGMDDVRAYNFIQRQSVTVHASERVEQALRNEFHYAFAEIKYPGAPEIKFSRIDTVPFIAGGLEFTPLPVLHHKLPVLGFRIGDFVYITDANSIPKDTWSKIQKPKVLVLNALRRTEHISHFTLDEAVGISKEINAEQTYLTHISHQMGCHVAVNKELPEGVQIAFDGLQLPLD